MMLLWLGHVCLILLISWWFYKSNCQPVTRFYYWYGFFAKIIAGLTFGIIYKTHFNGGDTWSYFESSEALARLVTASPSGYIEILFGAPIPASMVGEIGFSGQPRALFMVKLLSIFTCITGSNYWLSSAYFSLFSFCGLWALVNRITSTYPGSAKAALFSFVFYPSVLFWGSGISKEAIFLGGFGFLLSWFWPYFINSGPLKTYKWIAAILIMLVLVKLKYYYMAVFIPVLVTSNIIKWVMPEQENRRRGNLYWLILFAIILFTASWLHPNLRIDQLAALIKSNGQDVLVRTSRAAAIDFIDYPVPTTWMAINFPWAIITGLFRPNIGDWGTFLQNLAVLEHVIILVMLVDVLRTFKRYQLQNHHLFPCITYILILSGMLALSTPNFGTLVRYKVSFMPVFIFIILYRNIWWNRLTAKLP